MKTLSAFYTCRTVLRDIRGRIFLLNVCRPITRWRRFRSWLGWHEADTIVFWWSQPRLEGYTLILGGSETGCTPSRRAECQRRRDEPRNQSHYY